MKKSKIIMIISGIVEVLSTIGLSIILYIQTDYQKTEKILSEFFIITICISTVLLCWFGVYYGMKWCLSDADKQ